MTPQQITERMQAVIRRESGARVAVTHRGGYDWTLSGTAEATGTAAQWLSVHGIMHTVDVAQYDDDPAFVCVYMREWHE